MAARSGGRAGREDESTSPGGHQELNGYVCVPEQYLWGLTNFAVVGVARSTGYKPGTCHELLSSPHGSSQDLGPGRRSGIWAALDRRSWRAWR
jgi:hypothetical protein